MMNSKINVKQLIHLIDLTSLNEDDTSQSIKRLCEKARTPHGPVATVCICPQFVQQACALLINTSIKIATVANFPKGDQLLTDCIESIKQLIRNGADEIDVVMPYENYLSGCRDDVKEFLEACRSICHPGITLKVILESGALINHDAIFDATVLAIEAGADFIKTSTGKITAGATPQAAEIILEAIKSCPNKKAGLKVSGGVRTVSQALDYLQLVKDKMGAHWITYQTLRFGASHLLEDILSHS